MRKIYKKHVRICKSCNRVDMVRKASLKRLCRECYRNAPKSVKVIRSTDRSITYLDDKGTCWQQNLKSGIRTLMLLSTCPTCDKQSYVRRCDINKSCVSCNLKGRPVSEETCRFRSERMQGESNINWKGGIRRTHHGYTVVYHPGHRLANSIGIVYEHRLVAEENLGRPLRPSEVVHHLDGNRMNNAWENLVVCSGRMHREIHAKKF